MSLHFREENGANGRIAARLAVIADTHVPDRVNELPPQFLDTLTSLAPTAILHAGDISTQGVLDELSVIAPVVAVKGNRDFSLYRGLPLIDQVEYSGVTVGLTHGHDGLVRYILDKFQYVFNGYAFDFHRRYLQRVIPDSDVVIFGHTHVPELVHSGKQLFFNPGSLMGSQGYDPVFGVLEIGEEKEIHAWHVVLSGVKRRGRVWEEIQ